MRIAFAMINCNRRDGSARAVNEVAERLARRGHEVHLFAREAEDIDLQLVQWHPVPGPNWPEVADFWSYHFSANNKLRHSDFEIIHSIGPNTARANVITIQNIQPAKWEIMRQYAGEERVSPPRRFTRWLYLTTTSAAEKNLYTARPGKSSLLFLPVSIGVEKELKNHYQIGTSMVRIVPNAADTKIFHPVGQAERKARRAQYGFQEQDIVGTFSGGEWARKGLDLAIKGVAKCQFPNLKLFVAGDDPDRKRFEKLVEECGAVGRVMFGGFRTDIARLMSASDFFLFPSHYEAFSLATIEAAACGLPIIASRINGTEDLIQPGTTGDFIRHDPDDIARVLNELAADPIRISRLGENARLLVEKNYTWDRITDLTEEAYEEFLSSR